MKKHRTYKIVLKILLIPFEYLFLLLGYIRQVFIVLILLKICIKKLILK